MSRTDAQRRKASPERLRHSQSLAKRRQRLSQAMVRSTIHRFGRTTNLLQLRALDDLDVDLGAGCGKAIAELRPLVAAVGVKLEQERVEAEQRAHQQHAAVAVLHIGGMHDSLHQQALGIDQDVSFLALDLLAAIEARRVDRGPPFSALLTLWLSMIAAVGLACRSAASRHAT